MDGVDDIHAPKWNECTIYICVYGAMKRVESERKKLRKLMKPRKKA